MVDNLRIVYHTETINCKQGEIMHTIIIPKKEIPEQSFVMFNPQEEMEGIIKDNLGYDMSNAFRELIFDLTFDVPEGDDYEKIADGYYQMLLDVWQELEEIVSAKRIDRKRLEKLYETLNKNL